MSQHVERTESDRSTRHTPPQPNHVSGTPKGEEQALSSHEPGRDPEGKHYQSARDATGINADKRQPIHPAMPHIPPA